MSMRVSKYPMIAIALALAMGIVWSKFTEVFDVYFYGSAVALLTLFLCYLHWRLLRNSTHIRSIQAFYCGAILLFVALGGLVAEWQKPVKPILDNKDKAASLLIIEKLKSNDYYHRYYAEVQMDGQQPFKVLFYQANQMKSLAVSQQFTGIFTFEEISSPKNPYGFDYQSYLSNRGVFYQTRLYSEHAIIALSEQKNIKYYINYFRQKLIDGFAQHQFDENTQGVVMALLFGDKSELTDEMVSNYRNAGVMHVLAVSGLHVGILYLALRYTIGYLFYDKRLKFLIILLFLIAFACLSGLASSVVRAVVMFGLFGVGQLFFRRSSTINILAVTGFFMLIFRPAFLFEVGFQLSFLAVFSIVYMYPIISRFVNHRYKVLAWLQTLLGVSLVAQLGVLPLSVYYFGQIPLLFLVGNFFAIPLNSLALIIALALLLINLLWSDLAILIGKVLDFVLNLSNYLLSKITSFEHAIVADVPLTLVQTMVLTLLVFTIAFWVKSKRYKVLIAAFSLLIIFQLTYYQSYFSNKDKIETVLFYDTQTVVLAQLNQQKMRVYANQVMEVKTYITDYRQAHGLSADDCQYLPFNRAWIGQKRLLVIDSTAVYPTDFSVDYLVLYDSPNINLDRCLSVLQPKKVIFHPKNAHWKKELWRATCTQKNIPFHDMREKGLVYFDE